MALLLRRRGSSGGFRPTLPNFHVCAPPLLHSPDSDSIAELAACLVVAASPLPQRRQKVTRWADTRGSGGVGSNQWHSRRALDGRVLPSEWGEALGALILAILVSPIMAADGAFAPSATLDLLVCGGGLQQ